MIRLLVPFLLILLGGHFSSATCTTEIDIKGGIGPASLDWIQRSKETAEKNNCESILIMINTPGGNLQSTRRIVEEILNSDIPFLCLIGPSGAHAGSAGAIIMQACHISGGMEATNIGAATPISGGGEKMSEDMRNKIINDTRSWVVGLAKLRGRSEEFAKNIIETAEALPSEEAQRKGAIDWVGAKKEDFLKFASGRKVKMSEDKETVVVVGDIQKKQEDLRYQVMSFLMSPQIAYFLFMGSLGLLYFELTHPGMIAPGVLGAIGLGISLMALHMLDVETGGLVLIFLGLALMILEVFVTSFGILGIGGVISFFVGSLFLFDPEKSGYSLPLSSILPTTVFLGACMLGIAWLALSTRRVKDQADFAILIGKAGSAKKINSDGRSGQIIVNGELWKFEAQEEVAVGDQLEVLENHGFTLKVKVIQS